MYYKRLLHTTFTQQLVNMLSYFLLSILRGVKHFMFYLIFNQLCDWHKIKFMNITLLFDFFFSFEILLI